jgi:hypothetical protein
MKSLAQRGQGAKVELQEAGDWVMEEAKSVAHLGGNRQYWPSEIKEGWKNNKGNGVCLFAG